MAEQILTDCSVLLDGYDLSGDHNKIALTMEREMQDRTVFKGGGGRLKKGGLFVCSAALEGFWKAGTDELDEVLWNRFGVSNKPLTLGVETGADGEIGYSFLPELARYVPGGAVGDLMPFSLDAEGNGLLVRGTFMHNATRVASGNGTARQLGAVAAGEQLYAALHVLSGDGVDTLDVIVESDDNAGMTSAITRISFTQATQRFSERKSVAGAITDDYWRVSWTIAGTSPSFTFVVLVGIL